MSARSASHSQHQRNSNKRQQRQQTKSNRPTAKSIPLSSSRADGGDHRRSISPIGTVRPEEENEKEKTDRAMAVSDDDDDDEFQELEATLDAFRLTSHEEAIAIVQQHRHRQPRQERPSDEDGRAPAPAAGSSTSATDPSSPIPSFSGEDDSFSSFSATATNGAHQNGSPKKTKRVLSQLDVNELIQMKISQLESASVKEDDDEKVIGKKTSFCRRFVL